MDCASVHISKEYTAAMQEQWPHVKLVYVPATFTAVAQPLDRAFMRPFTACMPQLAAEHFAGILVATAPDDPVTFFDLRVGNLKPVLMSWVGPAIAKGRHIFCCVEESDSNSRHVRGGLGKRSGRPRCRRTVQERQRPSAA